MDMIRTLAHQMDLNDTDKENKIDGDDECRNKKIDQFVNSCEYDIKEGDIETLIYRVNRFLLKYEDSEQAVMEGLFEKVCNPGEDPILNWILGRMEDKAVKHVLEKLFCLKIIEMNNDRDEEDESEPDSYEDDNHKVKEYEPHNFLIRKKRSIRSNINRRIRMKMLMI